MACEVVRASIGDAGLAIKWSPGLRMMRGEEAHARIDDGRRGAGMCREGGGGTPRLGRGRCEFVSRADVPGDDDHDVSSALSGRGNRSGWSRGRESWSAR